MRRDYTDEAKKQLLKLVSEVESEKWSDVTDWLGDRFYDLEELVGLLSLHDDLSNVDSYHKAIIDKNNATANDIEKIFQNVYEVDDAFVTRIAACKTRLDSYTNMVIRLALTIDPDNAGTPISDLDNLDKSFEEYEQVRDSMSELINSDGGLSQEQLDKMDDNARQRMLENLAESILATSPSVKVGQQVEIPIGSNLVFYYKVDGKMDGEGDGNIDLTLHGDELKFNSAGYGDDYSVSYDKDGNTTFKYKEGNWTSTSDANKNSIAYKSDYETTTKIESDGTVTVTKEWEYGGSTYTYKESIGLTKASIEESKKTETGHGSVTTTVGLKTTENNKWKPLPEYVPVESPSYSPTYHPTFSPDWEKVAIGTTVVIGVGVVATVVIFCPEAAPALLLAI